MATLSSVLAWRTPGNAEPGGLPSIGSHSVNAGDPDSIPGSGRSPGEGNGNPLQYYCLEIPWTEEPGRLQPMGSQGVGHDWATLPYHNSPNMKLPSNNLFTFKEIKFLIFKFLLKNFSAQMPVLLISKPTKTNNKTLDQYYISLIHI